MIQLFGVAPVKYFINIMKLNLLPFFIALLLGACSSSPMSNENATKAGAGAGALGGAAVGAVIGHQSGNAKKGAAIGAGVGFLSGLENGKKWFGGDGSIQKTRRGN